mmetsp:Transcript_9441/g.21705  ORF Transcript_9441/g.21705 Transcript_9441/m.21705 type:complete len:114 (-) Transcript_9441:481-822(-)
MWIHSNAGKLQTSLIARITKSHQVVVCHCVQGNSAAFRVTRLPALNVHLVLLLLHWQNISRKIKHNENHHCVESYSHSLCAEDSFKKGKYGTSNSNGVCPRRSISLKGHEVPG